MPQKEDECPFCLGEGVIVDEDGVEEKCPHHEEDTYVPEMEK